MVGFMLWTAMLITPLLFFARHLNLNARASQFAVALAGLLVVLSYFSFGLTEVIFWSVKRRILYALMVFLLMGFCFNGKEKIG